MSIPAVGHWTSALSSFSDRDQLELPRSQGCATLAIQLGLAAADPSSDWPVRVLARQIRRGNGGLPREQIEWLHEVSSLYRARSGRGWGGSEIDLSSIDTPHLWNMLDAAAAAGIAFVHPNRGVGGLPSIEPAQLTVDIRRQVQTEGLLIDADVTVGGTPVNYRNLVFLGTPAHGIVYWNSRSAHLQLAHRPFQLAHFSVPVPERFQNELLLHNQQFMPKSEQTSFLHEYYPGCCAPRPSSRRTILSTRTASRDPHSFSP